MGLMAQFTRTAIVNSFIRLLNEKPLDKITVKDIVDDCGVNRNTFYYHFQDIYALLDELFRTELQKILKEDGAAGSWQEALLVCTEFARENKRAVYHVYQSGARDYLEDYMRRLMEKMMEAFVRREAQGMDLPEEDILVVAAFYQAALNGMVLEWLRRDMKEDPERIIHKIGVLFDGTVKYALLNSAKAQGRGAL